MKTKGWEECALWKTKASYLSWLRGQFRLIWKNYPVKNEFKRENLIPVPKEWKHQYHPATRRVGQCEQCEMWFPASKLQVDHIKPAGTLTELEHVPIFIDNLLCPKDNMRLLCKPCHAIITHMEKKGMDFKEAELDKKAVAFMKLTVTKQKKWLKDHGCTTEQTKNAANRKQAYKDIIN